MVRKKQTKTPRGNAAKNKSSTACKRAEHGATAARSAPSNAPAKRAGAKSTKKVNQARTNYIPVQIKDHKDYNGGHPHAIMDDIDNKHVSVGFSTQKKKGKGRKSGTNYTMEKSPLDDGQQSYMRRQAIVAPVSEYEKPRQGTMTQNDYERAKQYAEKAKQKYITKKKGKKK